MEALALCRVQKLFAIGLFSNIANLLSTPSPLADIHRETGTNKSIRKRQISLALLLTTSNLMPDTLTDMSQEEAVTLLHTMPGLLTSVSALHAKDHEILSQFEEQGCEEANARGYKAVFTEIASNPSNRFSAQAYAHDVVREMRREALVKLTRTALDKLRSESTATKTDDGDMSWAKGIFTRARASSTGASSGRHDTEMKDAPSADDPSVRACAELLMSLKRSCDETDPDARSEQDAKRTKVEGGGLQE